MQSPSFKLQTPEVTVVIPAFNARNCIIRTLDSVLAQTFKPIEVIIVDDDSSDGTDVIVSKYLNFNNLSNWRLLRQSNGGPASARDKAIRLAVGSHVALLDSDDLWLPKKLEASLAYLIELRLDIIGAPLIVNRPEDSCRLINPKEMLFTNPYFTSTVIFSRESYIDIGGFSLDQRYSEDYKLWLSFAWSGKRCGQMSQSNAAYHPATSESHKGLSSHIWQMQVNELANFRLLCVNNLIPLGWCLLAQLVSWFKFIYRLIRIYI